MTPTAQRIAIATHLGWTHIEDKSHNLMMPPGFSVCGYPPDNPIIGKKEQLPQFNLDEMYEAENSLREDQRFEYHNFIFEIVPPDENHGPAVPDGEDVMTPSGFSMLHADAETRREAFLRTLGLWGDV